MRLHAKKNLKNIMIALSLLHVHAVYAGTMGTINTLDTPQPYDGFYLGADVGLSNLQDKEHHSITPETQHLGSLGLVGGGFVGYDYSFTEKLKLSIEGFGQANGLNTSIQHNNNGTTYKANARYNAGVRLLPGYAFYPGMIGHILLGYSNAQFNAQDNGTYGFVNNTFNQNGFQSGLGWVAAFTPHVSLRIDTLYTFYSGKTSNGITNTRPAVTQAYTNTFNTLEGDLSLIYKFN